MDNPANKPVKVIVRVHDGGGDKNEGPVGVFADQHIGDKAPACPGLLEIFPVGDIPAGGGALGVHNNLALGIHIKNGGIFPFLRHEGLEHAADFIVVSGPSRNQIGQHPDLGAVVIQPSVDKGALQADGILQLLLGLPRFVARLR
ncbi:hypothetical protein D3C75_619900 [compost metagenome]